MKKVYNTGSALLMAIIVVLIIGGIGTAFIYWFASESRHATQKELHSKEIAMGEAGIQKAIKAMKDPGLGDFLRTDYERGYTTSFVLLMDGTSVQVTVEHLGD